MTASTSLQPRRLNHYAIPTADLNATHQFWTEVMGCEFLGAFAVDPHMMSTGDMSPRYLHGFYAFSDGSCIAFFEGTGLIPKDDGVPAWAKHLALSVDSREQLAEWKEHLIAVGVDDVFGEVDHGGAFYSLYFQDPTSGQRLELTYQTMEFTSEIKTEGLATLEAWANEKKVSASPSEQA